MKRAIKQRNPEQFKSKLHKGDEVIVLTGRSRGEVAKIEFIDKKNHRVYLEGVNLGKRHTKADMSKEAGIVEIPMPLHISNVALVDPQSKKATRIGFKIEEGRKVRVAKKSGTVLS